MTTFLESVNAVILCRLGCCEYARIVDYICCAGVKNDKQVGNWEDASLNIRQAKVDASACKLFFFHCEKYPSFVPDFHSNTGTEHVLPWSLVRRINRWWDVYFTYLGGHYSKTYSVVCWTPEQLSCAIVNYSFLRKLSCCSVY